MWLILDKYDIAYYEVNGCTHLHGKVHCVNKRNNENTRVNGRIINIIFMAKFWICSTGEGEPAAADPTYDPFDFQSFQNPDVPTHKPPTRKTPNNQTTKNQAPNNQTPNVKSPTDTEPAETPRTTSTVPSVEQATTSTFPSVDQAPSKPNKNEMATREPALEIFGKLLLNSMQFQFKKSGLRNSQGIF